MLLRLRFGGLKIVCAGKITSASAKPGPSALPNGAPLHVSATNIPILILLALLISQTPPVHYLSAAIFQVL